VGPLKKIKFRPLTRPFWHAGLQKGNHTTPEHTKQMNLQSHFIKEKTNI
jgi:hypothetical protein